MSYTSHLDLLNSRVPSEMDDWAKNKITKMAFLKAKNLFYSDRGSDQGLVCSAAHLIFRNFYHKLYQKSNLSFQKEIVVLTQVLTDGLGDYYNALAAAEAIKKSFPKQQICMIPVFCSTHQLDTVSLPRKINYYLCKSNESCSQEIIERIRNASFVLEIPWKVDVFTSRDIAAARDHMMYERKYTHIAEYGSHAHGMGLDYQDEGIFIKKMPSNSSLIYLKNEELKSCIFGKKSVSENDIKEYFQNHEMFFSYLPSNKKVMRMFLYTVIFSLAYQNKIVDIFSHLSPSDLEIDFQFLKEQGIATIEFICKDSNVNVIKEIAKKGKLLRIFNLFPLSQKDMHILMINSHLLTGCTGDQSFSEVISFNKLPFYEFRTHKQLFFWHYLRVAELELEPEGTILSEYLNTLMRNIEIDTLSEEEIKQQAVIIGKIINNPALFEETQKINEIIQKKFSFNESLKGIVAQKIFQEKFPPFAKLEQKIISLVCKQQISSLQEIWNLLNREAEKLMTT